jgi:hypothetical protein
MLVPVTLSSALENKKVLPSTQDIRREVLTSVGRFLNVKRFRFFRHINIISNKLVGFQQQA